MGELYTLLYENKTLHIIERQPYELKFEIAMRKIYTK